MQSAKSVIQDELEDYVSTPPDSVDAVQFWIMHKRKYPGFFVAVERILRMGKDVVGLRRHSLKAETVQLLSDSNSKTKSEK
jgi:hypothetical protein